MLNTIDKHSLWTQLHNTALVSNQIETDCLPIIQEASLDHETMRYFLDKTIGMTNDHRMVEVMKLLLSNGGKQVVEEDLPFRHNLMKKAQTHENQFVVIYEDWAAAEAYLNVYQMLEIL